MDPNQPGFAPSQPMDGAQNPNPNPTPEPMVTGDDFAQMQEAQFAQQQLQQQADTLAAAPINEAPATPEPATTPTANFGAPATAQTAGNFQAQPVEQQPVMSPEPAMQPAFGTGQATPAQAQPGVFTTASAAVMDSTPYKPKRRKIVPIIIIILGLGLVAAALIFLLPKLSGKKDNYGVTMLREKIDSGNYAMFSLKDGKRLTDFLYTESKLAKSGDYIVKDENGKSMILNLKGEVTATADDSNEFKSCGGAFISAKSSDGDEEKTTDDEGFLVSKTGEKLADDGAYVCADELGYYAYSSDGSTKIYSSDGKEIAATGSDSVELVKNYGYSVLGSPAIKSGNDFYLLAKNSLGGPYTIKSLKKNDETKLKYSSADGSIAIWENDESEQSWLLQNGTVTEMTEKCTSVSYSTYGTEGVQCVDEDYDTKIVLDAENNKFIDEDDVDGLTVAKTGYWAQIKDGKISFYANGEKTNTVDGKEISLIENGDNVYYLVKVPDAYTETKTSSWNLDDDDTEDEEDEEWDEGLDDDDSYFDSFSYETTITKDRLKSAAIYNINGEIVADLKDNCSSNNTIGVIGKDIAYCTKAQNEDSPNSSVGFFSVDLNRPIIAFKDGKEFSLPDGINLISPVTDERYLVANIDLNALVSELMSIAFSAMASSMNGETPEINADDLIDKLKIEQIGIIDSDGNTIVNPSDYNGLAVSKKSDFENINYESLFGDEASDIDFSGAVGVALKRKDGNGNDYLKISDGSVIVNTTGTLVWGTSTGYYGIDEGSAVKYYLMDGTLFYTQE